MGNLIEYFEKTVENNKSKIALSFQNDSITFEELRNSAMKCASMLSAIGTNRPVGVYANRSLETSIWFIGILYSGNYYVPIDPDIPIEKMQLIFDDAHFSVIVGAEHNREMAASAGFEGTFYTLDDLSENLYRCPSVNEADAAYMVYTSGSTGKPKGVLKSHGAVMNFIDSYVETFGFTGEEIIGNQTPFFFDAAAKDFYLMVKTGASIEIIPTELFSMTTQLIEFMNEKRISFASWVPTALSLVAQVCPFSLVKPEYLKRMFFVGEVMPMKHLNKWRSELPDVEYVNLYGQSEIAGICCFYRVMGTFDNADTLPMGKPLKNCRVYLMDGAQIIEDQNHIGELYIVSEALAIGYNNDSQKTDAVFIEKDFGQGMERCFKTGDMAFYDQDWNLVFAARTDFQIKHMGHRIELGEIEAVAGALPEIDRCCCIYQEKKKKLVLFCQLSKGTALDGRQIRSMLRPIITNYMLPNKVIVLNALPLNANGKIDRQKLKTMSE